MSFEILQAIWIPRSARDFRNRLHRLKTNVFQRFRLLQLGLAGWEFVDAQNERQDISLLLNTHFSRLALGHGEANLVEQFAYSQAVPTLQEILAGERWSVFMSSELFVVAGGAFAIVKRLAALGLLG